MAKITIKKMKTKGGAPTFLRKGTVFWRVSRNGKKVGDFGPTKQSAINFAKWLREQERKRGK